MSIGAKAQTYTVINNDNCDVIIATGCNDGVHAGSSITSPSITVPCCGGTNTITVGSCSSPYPVPVFAYDFSPSPCLTVYHFIDATSVGVLPSPQPLGIYCPACIAETNPGVVDIDYTALTITFH